MSQTASPDSERPKPTSGALMPFSTAGTPLTLASASPRRRELLACLGARFHTNATDGEEHDYPPPQAIIATLPTCPVLLATHPTLLAWRKVIAACADAPDSVIIGADTIVVLDGDVLGKPGDSDHACAMLRRLSGRMHTVYTGLAVIRPAPGDNRQADKQTSRLAAAPSRPVAQSPSLRSSVADLQLDLAASDVFVADLTDAEIADYVATGEPMDKAGAYGIQGLGGRLVRSVVGSYTCVVGLPLVSTYRLLVAAGYTELIDPPDAYLRWLKAQGKEPLPCPPTFP
jgi:septum formation protein